jgi:DNA-binding MarR family transcriptional regulator
MRNEEITQVALAGCIDTDPMTLSGILDRLEKRGLVERYTDPNDSRAKLARLTDDGTNLVRTAKNVGRELYENALVGLSDKDRDAVVSGLKCIRDNLNHLELTAEEKEAV